MTVTVGHSVLSVPGIGQVRIEDTFHLKGEHAELLTVCNSSFQIPADW